MPLVSVVIPTHNRPEMLAEAIASVQAQTFTDYEIIVVSNGENADVRRVNRQIAASQNAEYLELDQGNVSSARNVGVESASGEWIAFLDDDDLWLPTKLERQVLEAKRTGADIIACDFAKFSKTDVKSSIGHALRTAGLTSKVLVISVGGCRRPRPWFASDYSTRLATSICTSGTARTPICGVGCRGTTPFIRWMRSWCAVVAATLA